MSFNGGTVSETCGRKGRLYIYKGEGEGEGSGRASGAYKLQSCVSNMTVVNLR
jgi:hypothetical protein